MLIPIKAFIVYSVDLIEVESFLKKIIPYMKEMFYYMNEFDQPV